MDLDVTYSHNCSIRRFRPRGPVGPGFGGIVFLSDELRGIPAQAGRMKSLFATLAGAVLLIGLGAGAVSWTTGTPLSHLTRDPTAVLGGRCYIGLVSTAGLLVWAAAAGVCFLAAALLAGSDNRARRFLLASGGVTLFLALDDAFLIHEEILCVHLGLSQSLIYGIYILVIAVYLLSFAGFILRTDFLVLLLAVFFLGLSLGLDVLSDHFDHTSDLETFVEDMLKLTGILFWLSYLARVSYSKCQK